MSSSKGFLLCVVLLVCIDKSVYGSVSKKCPSKILDVMHCLLDVAGHHSKGTGKRGHFVAFDVSLSRSFDATKHADVVLYDKINLNIGGAYRRGEFICPQDGVYEFTWITLCAASRRCETGIYLNGKKKRLSHNLNVVLKQYNLTTTSQIIHLKKHDKITIVLLYKGYQIYSDGNDHSSFQGKLLHAD